MESPAPTTADAPTTAGLADFVRAALAERYDAPVVHDLADRAGVAVLGGKALAHAREAAASAGFGGVEQLVVALDVAGLPWRGVPAGGLRLWRQHGHAGTQGELVTEVEAGDPPLQVLHELDGWQLVRLADGATGWLEPVANVSAEADVAPAEVGDPCRVDTDAFVAAAVALEGTPYVWGGTTDAGIDCSGLVQRSAWRASRCWLPRHSRALLRVGARVAPSAPPAAGDVLVLQRDPATVDAERAAQLAAAAAAEAGRRAVPVTGPAVHPMHVAIALSPTEVLHASRDEMQVVREPLASLRERYRVLGVRRLGGAPA